MKIIRYSLNQHICPPLPMPIPTFAAAICLNCLPALGCCRPVRPVKIVCVGRNYAEHAKELGNPIPAEPLIFLKPVSSLIASGDAIVYPRICQRLDYEGELGVIISKRARNVKSSDAADFIFGYTCVNEVTARDLQKKDGQWTRGKGSTHSAPWGPALSLATKPTSKAFAYAL